MSHQNKATSHEAQEKATRAEQLPAWVLQFVVPAPGQPFAMLTVLDSFFRLLSVEWVQGLNVNVSTLKGLSAQHGFPGSLICDDSIEFRSNELRAWANAQDIILKFKHLSRDQNRDIRFNQFCCQSDQSTTTNALQVRIEFRGMEQADFYLDLFQAILTIHSHAPGNIYRRRARGRMLGRRPDAETPTDLVNKLNFAKIAKTWVHHSTDLLEPAFIRGFEEAIKDCADDGFASHSSPSVLAVIALNEVRRLEEIIATRRPVIYGQTTQ